MKRKNMIRDLESRGIEIVSANDGYVALYHGSSRRSNSLIGYYKVCYGNAGSYIRYDRSTYYFD